MRGTPHEFFSFLPEQERTAAIQAFAIIRRCDDALRFEALAGSWLVARLISILRMDSSAIMTTTTNQNTSGANGSSEETSNNPSSDAGNDSDPNKEATAAASGTTIRRTVCSDKPLFMYVGHLQSSGAAMNGFATHLAGIISSFSTSKGTSTTVASTISYCLNLLEHSKHKVRLLNGLCSIIIQSHPSMTVSTNDRGLTIAEKARQDLKRILTTALCCILLQVKTSCEAVQDFEYIWEACRDKAATISSVFDDNQASKECAWLLSIAAYQSEENASQSVSHADRRWVRLLLSGACITIVAQSALWLGTNTRSKNKSFHKHDSSDSNPNTQKFSGNEAIAKLCMLGKANTTNTKMINDSDISKRNNISSATLLDIVVGAIKDLSPAHKSISQDEFLKELQKGTFVAAKMKLLSNDKNIESTLKTSAPLKSMFSTHHGRVSSIAVLTNFCRILLNSSQNLHSPNGPSIFTGFSFIDETLLVAQSTTFVRLYLIDFSERKSATSVEHVAAEVQFYKRKAEPAIESEDEDEDSHQQLLPDTRNDAEFQVEIMDTLELNAWTSKLLESSAKRIKPSAKLLFYIGSSNAKKGFSENQETVGQVMIPSINKSLQRLIQSRKDSTDIIAVDQTGGMEADKQKKSISSRSKTQIKTIGRAMLSLYYDSIESILDYETGRLKTTSHRNLLLNVSFHKALLSACLICVVHATSSPLSNFQSETTRNNSHLFVQSILTIMDCTAYEYMKVSESFVQSIENSSKSVYNRICNIPMLLQRKIQDTEEQIFESLLWTKCPNLEKERTLIGVLEHFISSQIGNKILWPPRVLESVQGQESSYELGINNIKTDEESMVDNLTSESNYVNYLITKVMSLVSRRIARLSKRLRIPSQNPIIKQIWHTFRLLLRKQCHLLFDNHIDQVILCTIYGVGKVMKYSPELTFSKIIDVYKSVFQKRLGKERLQTILYSIKLKNNEKGTVIDFYNQMYLPSMKKCLLKSKHFITSTLPKEEDSKKRSSDEMGNSSTSTSIKKHKGTIKLKDSNLHVNFMCSDSKPKENSPKSRVLYSFGDASSIKSLNLINKTISNK